VRQVKLLLVASLLISVFAMPVAAAATIKDGQKCSPVGASFKQSGFTFVCTKVNGKAVWKKKTVTKPSTQISSKSFSLESISFSDDYGISQGSARVKNTSTRTKSGLMTITIFKADGKSVYSTMIGSVQGVLRGEVVTVQFVGTGDLPVGTFKYSFQVDMEY
jgi:hypothetical protein